MSNFKLDFCDSKARQGFVEKWHYSRSVPPPPGVSFGV